MKIRKMSIELMRWQCFGKSGKKMGLITSLQSINHILVRNKLRPKGDDNIYA